MNDIRARVESVIESQSGCAGDTLESYDWLDWMQLACDLEEEFGLSISDVELENYKTVDEIEQYVAQQMVEG